MFLHLEFSNTKILIIELFQDSAVEHWFNFFRSPQRKTGLCCKTKTKKPIEQHIIDNSWKDIKNTLRTMANYGFAIPFDLDDTWKYDQRTLNQLHRFFTHNAMWYNDTPLEPNPFDPTFMMPEEISDDRWHPLIDKINKAVHVLEKYSRHSSNSLFVDTRYPIDDICIEFLYKDQWIHFDQQDQLQNYRYFDYCDIPNLVCLSRTILGKCVLQSFYDDDDPTDKDCTGRLCSNGGLSLSFNDNKQRLYSSKEFRKWTEFYGFDIKMLPLEFPIGRAVNFPNDFNLDNKQIINISFLT